MKEGLTLHSKSTDCCFFLIYLLFLEIGEGREKERERNINVWLPPVCPPLGTWPATQACALTGNRIGSSLVRRPALNLLSYTSQGFLKITLKKGDEML